jgi:beta-aspartyl-peptidase (threonine type)
MGTLDFPQPEFKVLGREAVLARGQWRLKMPDGKESTGMTSVTFQKLPEGWRIVHDHSSS